MNKLIERDTMRARIGASYGRVAPRKVIGYLTGLSNTAVHNRCQGDTAIRVEEIARIGRSTDPRVNAFHVPAEIMVAIEGARRNLTTVECAISLGHGLHAESITDGAEDVSQDELRSVLWAVLLKDDAMTLPERAKLVGILAKHRDNVTVAIANLLRVAGDCEALIEKLGPLSSEGGR